MECKPAGAAVENLWLTTLPGLNDHRCQGILLEGTWTCVTFAQQLSFYAGLADVLCAQDVCPPAEAYPTQVPCTLEQKKLSFPISILMMVVLGCAFRQVQQRNLRAVGSHQLCSKWVLRS
eukprot:919244-Amphidinium_carterae.1